MKENTMACELEEVPAREPKCKTLDVRLNIIQDDLETRVKKSFEMAKSAGLELDVTFSCWPSRGVLASS